MASTRQIGKGLWDNPGRVGVHAFEETAKELDVIWEMMIRELVK